MQAANRWSMDATLRSRIIAARDRIVAPNTVVEELTEEDRANMDLYTRWVPEFRGPKITAMYENHPKVMEMMHGEVTTSESKSSPGILGDKKELFAELGGDMDAVEKAEEGEATVYFAADILGEIDVAIAGHIRDIEKETDQRAQEFLRSQYARDEVSRRMFSSKDDYILLGTLATDVEAHSFDTMFNLLEATFAMYEDHEIPEHVRAQAMRKFSEMMPIDRHTSEFYIEACREQLIIDADRIYGP